VLAALGDSAIYFLPADVFSALAAHHPPFAGMTYDSIGLRGTVVGADDGRATATPVAAAAP
jgi:hypothetical protein